jgi:hypothetical protein
MRQQVYFRLQFRRGNAELSDNQGENTPVGGVPSPTGGARAIRRMMVGWLTLSDLAIAERLSPLTVHRSITSATQPRHIQTVALRCRVGIWTPRIDHSSSATTIETRGRPLIKRPNIRESRYQQVRQLRRNPGSQSGKKCGIAFPLLQLESERANFITAMGGQLGRMGSLVVQIVRVRRLPSALNI